MPQSGMEIFFSHKIKLLEKTKNIYLIKTGSFYLVYLKIIALNLLLIKYRMGLI